MSITQIESELKNLSPTDLRRLALNSWAAFVQKEKITPAVNECEETDPDLLAVLDAAITRADQPAAAGLTGQEVRTRIRQWTTR